MPSPKQGLRLISREEMLANKTQPGHWANHGVLSS